MKRSKHGLSNYKLTTLDLGWLCPVGHVEVLPGDTFQAQSAVLLRTSPLVAPVMHPVEVRLHHWFVPYRILWSDFEDFMTGKQDITVPQLQLNGGFPDAGALKDRLGLPAGFDGTASALPFAAYNKIWMEFYRDQDLDGDRQDYVETGVDFPVSAAAMKRISWQRDYFTSARPWPQKGPAISLPLGTTAPVMGLGVQDAANPRSNPTQINYADGSIAAPGAASGYQGDAAGEWSWLDDDGNGHPNVYADLANASAATVEQLREAFALQRYAEARARYGSRYTEYLAYLGVKSSDARLQRPEYLGGGKQTISFSEVLATAEGQNTVVGDLKGHGIAALRTRRFRRFFSEHGILMSLMSVRPKTIYANAVHRSWLRKTKEDFWQKELESLGHQEIQNVEVYGNASAPTDTWGYTPRYDDYRTVPSTIHGDFESVIDDWHFARKFDAQPALNSTFTQCTPAGRPFATTNVDPLVCMVSHSIQARRMLRKYASV